MNSTEAASLMWPSPEPARWAIASVSIGRNRTTGRDQVVGDLGDHGDFGAGPRQNGVDPLHVCGDQGDQRVYRSVGRALEGNNRHAGLHIWQNRIILEHNRNCAKAARARSG
jgi:hypothetical protein